jgi:rare lipoprotein A
MSFELSPAHPSGIRGVGRELKTQNSKLRTAAAALALGCAVLFVGCAHQKAAAPPTRPTAPPPSTARKPGPPPVDEGWTEKGLASWYGKPYHGRRTASGEIYDMHALTAAHRSLAFGAMVRVTRRDTGADVTVRINDRGPFVEGRVIDLSYAAARKIGLDVDGVAPVKITLLGRQGTTKRTPERAERRENCFWVQVGAFADRGNALRAEADLEGGGETVVVLEGADHLWRVRLGPFDGRRAAEKACDRVGDAWPGAHIVTCGG